MSMADRISRLRLDGDDLRLAATCVGGGLLLAVMTGPEGDLTTPLYTIQKALFTSHVWGFLAFGVVLALWSVYRRKVRMGVIASKRTGHRISLADRFQHLVANAKPPALFGIFFVGLIAALLIADFTGPPVADKLSFTQLFHQFVNTRTYGYIAIIFWLLNALRIKDKPKSTNKVLMALDSAWAKIIGGLLGGLFFAFCADPWLPVRFRFSHLTASGSSDSAFFHHWTTYLWMAVGLIIGIRFALLERTAARRSAATRWRTRYVSVSHNTRFALYGGALFVAVEAPKFLSPFWQDTIFQQIGIFCLLAIGLNVVVGFAGLLDLGYVAFYALGAYTNAYFSGALPIHPPFILNTFLVVPIAILVAMLAGVLLGLPTLRLRGDYLAIVTLGFGEIVYVLASNLTSITDGAGGTGPSGSFSMHLLGIHFVLNGQAITDDLNFYYLLLAFMIPILFFFNSLNHSKVGRSWAAIREDEVAASSLGINGLKYKVMAFAIGASTSGVAGVLSSAKLGSLFPSDFALQVSITVLVLVILGGMASMTGVLVGSAFVGWLLQFLVFHSFIDYNDADKFMYLGAILVLTMIFRPLGMLPAKRRLREFQDAEAGLGTADAVGTAVEGPLA